MSEQTTQTIAEEALEAATSPWKDIAWNGIWKQNTGLVQILGLCPILAISTSFVNAVSLGLATILVMAMANVAISLLRNLIPYEIRIQIGRAHV